MKALRCNAYGPVGHLALEDIVSPVRGAGQVVVTVAALISARYPLSESVEALFAMMRRDVAGKIVIVPYQ